MGGQNRDHQGVGKEGAELRGGDAGLPGAGECVGQGALTRRRAGQSMRPRAADVVQILGDVGEVREVAEGSDDSVRLAGRQAVQQALQLPSRRFVLIAVEADGGLPDALDQAKHRVALLVAYGVAEDFAK
jgi:hypothetical protein